MRYITKGKSRHFVGIVPCTGFKTEYKMPWPDIMVQINEQYMAVTRSILECACAGCDSIWVVMYDKFITLIKHAIGESVRDPFLINLPFKNYPEMHERDIPIYYVPLNLNHQQKRDTVSFSIMRGAQASYFLSKYLSKWILPWNYFVSFPFGLTNPYFLMKNRALLRNKNVVYTFNGKSILTNDYLPFTFNRKDYPQFSQKYWRTQTLKWKLDDEGYLVELPKEEQYYSKKIKLNETFSYIKDRENFVKETQYWYDISSWSQLMDWYRSPYSDKLTFPNVKYFRKNSSKAIAMGEWELDLEK